MLSATERETPRTEPRQTHDRPPRGSTSNRRPFTSPSVSLLPGGAFFTLRTVSAIKASSKSHVTLHVENPDTGELGHVTAKNVHQVTEKSVFWLQEPTWRGMEKQVAGGKGWHVNERSEPRLTFPWRARARSGRFHQELARERRRDPYSPWAHPQCLRSMSSRRMARIFSVISR
jgi:hypothetical protein